MIKPGSMLAEVLKHIFKKPATVLYPFVKEIKADKFRGKLKFFAVNCIGCKICMKDCPSNAIVITKIADKQFECEVSLDKCIYCGQCVLSCPKKALEMTPDFELAGLNRQGLKVNYKNEQKPPESERPA